MKEFKWLTTLIFLFIAISVSVEAKNTGGFLRVDGERILDSRNRPVLLRGFNIEFKDFRTALGKRDIERIAEAGANSIRLAFSYHDLESSPFRYDEKAFRLLDLILDWCKQSGIYVILDMHLVPGAQNTHDFVVHREKTARFWNNKQYQRRFYSLWTYIAKRYRSSTIVAGYDLLNEPAPQEIRQYRGILNTVVERIRRHDTNHMLIVEEAILPGWVKEFPLVNDNNTVYSAHFFYPPQFSFYMTTQQRPITVYPGEMITAGESVTESRSEPLTESSAWHRLELKASPPEGAEIFKVFISSAEQEVTVWIDDLTLAVNGNPVDLPAPLVANGSFEIDYPGFNWNGYSMSSEPTGETARTGKRSLALTGCRNPCLVESSPISALQGEYVLSGWYKTRTATDKTHIGISWHKAKLLGHVDKAALAEQLQYVLDFRKKHRVPIYIGEFTAHRNPSAGSAGRYLQDLLDIFSAEGFHWSFWVYYSVYPGVGIFTGNSPELVNEEAWKVIRKYISKK